MNNFIIFFIMLALSAMGCGGGTHQHETMGEVKISLNNGERWQANIETTQGIKRMQEILAPHVEKVPADANMCKSLGESLQAELDGIIKQCTMTGDAHEQLHHFLTPLFSSVNQLKEGRSADCPETIRSLKAHLDSYEKYFQ
jgi:hypothetical protein